MASWPRIEVDDVQGIVLHGYKRLPVARFDLLEVRSAGPFRRWLRKVTGDGHGTITSAARRPEEAAVNVAFTPSGLRALDLPERSLSTFPREFLEGMASRAEQLGDVERSSPETWEWGGEPEGMGRGHVLLMSYGATEDAIRAPLDALRSEHPEAVEPRWHLVTHRGDYEHFGFRDGISQPSIRAANPPHQLTGALRPGAPENTVNAGEFLLGYLDEFGRYPDSPVVAGDTDAQRLLRPASSGFRDFGRNGSYLVARQLDQDVLAFWRHVSAANPADPVSLAAKMVGRWPEGAPLTLHPVSPPVGARDEAHFRYFPADRRGHGCPLGAHIRRANPRDSFSEEKPPAPGLLGEAFDDPARVANRHRLLRRGRPYCDRANVPVAELARRLSQLPPDAAVPAELRTLLEGERGIQFLCFGTSIRRQFEFVQQSWCNSRSFAGLRNDPDPLIGGGPGREHCSFTVQGPVPRHVVGLPSFVTTRGGEYFFMPSLRALRYLAAL